MTLSKAPGVLADVGKIGRTVDFVLPTSPKMAQFKTKVLLWYKEHGRAFKWREPDADLYTKIVSEVLLQRTRAETVSAFLPDFLRKYPSWEKLRGARKDSLTNSLKPIGLYRRRAASLHGLAREIVARNCKFPTEQAELETIPAVGQYVANAILLFAHSKRAPLLDASMARLLRRYFDLSPIKADIRYDKLLQSVAYRALDKTVPVKSNWAMLDLAAINCRSGVPICENCPLRRTCQFTKTFPSKRVD